MNKKEKKQTKTLQRLASAHNKLLDLIGAESLEGKDEIILKALNFVGRITSFGTIELLDKLVSKHESVYKLIELVHPSLEDVPSAMDLYSQLRGDLPVGDIFTQGYADSLRASAANALMALRKNMTVLHLELSMDIIKDVRLLDEIQKARLDIEDAVSMIGNNKPTILLLAAQSTDNEKLINLILENK